MTAVMLIQFAKTGKRTVMSVISLVKVSKVFFGFATVFFCLVVGASIALPRFPLLEKTYNFEYAGAQGFTDCIRITNDAQFSNHLKTLSADVILDTFDSKGISLAYACVYPPILVDNTEQAKVFASLDHINNMLGDLNFDAGSMAEVKAVAENNHVAAIVGSNWKNKVRLNQALPFAGYGSDIKVAAILQPAQRISTLQNPNNSVDNSIIVIADPVYARKNFSSSDLDIVLRNAIYINDLETDLTLEEVFGSLGFEGVSATYAENAVYEFVKDQQRPYKQIKFWSTIAGVLCAYAGVVAYLLSREQTTSRVVCDRCKAESSES